MWKLTSKFAKEKVCTLEENVLIDIPENTNSLQLFEAITSLNELVKYICNKTNLYAAQNWREFATNSGKIPASLGIDYIISVSKSPNLKCY